MSATTIHTVDVGAQGFVLKLRRIGQERDVRLETSFWEVQITRGCEYGG